MKRSQMVVGGVVVGLIRLSLTMSKPRVSPRPSSAPPPAVPSDVVSVASEEMPDVPPSLADEEAADADDEEEAAGPIVLGEDPSEEIQKQLAQ